LNDLHEGDVWFDHICYGAEFRVWTDEVIAVHDHMNVRIDDSDEHLHRT
jgi:hypothetical protein